MNETRRAFLKALDAARPIVASADVARHWDEQSLLEEFSIRGLAGHLVRAAGSVDAYLERPEPVRERPISAAAYYAEVLDTSDISAPLHTEVRERGEDEAREGHQALVRKFDDVAARLGERLKEESAERLVRVFKDLVLRLDDYLVTRIVELTVHTDDLALSVGRQPPALPPECLDLAITNLVGVARHRHGDLAVLRALSRRERDTVEALRVL